MGTPNLHAINADASTEKKLETAATQPSNNATATDAVQLISTSSVTNIPLQAASLDIWDKK